VLCLCGEWWRRGTREAYARAAMRAACSLSRHNVANRCISCYYKKNYIVYIYIYRYIYSHIGLFNRRTPHKCTSQKFKISKRARRPEWAKCKRRQRSGGRAPCSVRSSRSGPVPDSVRPAMAVAPQLPHAATAAGHDAAPRLTPRGASTASFQHFKAISRSDRRACAGRGR